MRGARQTAVGVQGAQSVAERLVAHAQGGAQGAVRRGAIVVQDGEDAFGQWRRLTGLSAGSESTLR